MHGWGAWCFEVSVLMVIPRHGGTRGGAFGALALHMQEKQCTVGLRVFSVCPFSLLLHLCRQERGEAAGGSDLQELVVRS